MFVCIYKKENFLKSGTTEMRHEKRGKMFKGLTGGGGKIIKKNPHSSPVLSSIDGSQKGGACAHTLKYYKPDGWGVSPAVVTTIQSVRVSSTQVSTTSTQRSSWRETPPPTPHRQESEGPPPGGPRGPREHKPHPRKRTGPRCAQGPAQDPSQCRPSSTGGPPPPPTPD